MVHYQFDEKVDFAIEKSIRSAQRFYNELRKAALEKGEKQEPPSFATFQTMAKGLMKATKLVQIDRLKNPTLKDVLDRAWSQKLLKYSTQKLMKDAYEGLLRKF